MVQLMGKVEEYVNPTENIPLDTSDRATEFSSTETKLLIILNLNFFELGGIIVPSFVKLKAIPGRILWEARRLNCSGVSFALKLDGITNVGSSVGIQLTIRQSH